MKVIKNIFDLRKVSFLLMTLPYIGFNWIELYHSPFFSFTKIACIIGLLIFIDIVVKLLISYFEKRERLISTIVITTTIVFFYGFYIENAIQTYLIDITEIIIRGRILMIFILLFTTGFLVLIKNKTYRILNLFFIIFIIISIVQNILNKNLDIQKSDKKNNFISFNLQNKKIKPIILIITDEYNSPDGLYKVFKDSSIYNFSNNLVKNNWVVKNNFYSFETSTIHSLSSLFNFNLSLDSQFKKSSINELGINKLMQGYLADSLSKKNVSIINFGIFDIGKTNPINPLYFYPKNLFEQFLLNTTYLFVKMNTNNFKISGFEKSFYSTSSHNKFIFTNLSNILLNRDNKYFNYVHLYMPHAPMTYESEFKLKSNNLNNYFSYWKFTNYKLTILLAQLIKDNNYKIILTGDHGYRADKRINPHYTFTSFYGFDTTELYKLKSVQDLGSLINAGY